MSHGEWRRVSGAGMNTVPKSINLFTVRRRPVMIHSHRHTAQPASAPLCILGADSLNVLTVETFLFKPESPYLVLRILIVM